MNAQQQSAMTIDQQRGESYGDFRRMAELAQRLKENLVTIGMNPVQKESMQLICTKLARIACGNPDHLDSWVDIAGYANLVVREFSRPESAMVGGIRPMSPEEYHNATKIGRA